MGDAVADLEDPNRDRAGIVDLSSRSIDTTQSSKRAQSNGARTGQNPGRPDDGGGVDTDPLPKAAMQSGRGSLDADDHGPKDSRTSPSEGDISDPLVLEDLLLLNPDGNQPISIDTLTFTDDGIGVTRSAATGHGYFLGCRWCLTLSRHGVEGLHRNGGSIRNSIEMIRRIGM